MRVPVRQAVVLASLAVLLAACHTAGGIRQHPEYAKVQEEVGQVITEVRNAEGTDLYGLLERLVAYDVFAVEQVSELARDPNARLRGNAVWVLAQINDPAYPETQKEIAAVLHDALKDPDRLVQFEAARGLVQYRNDWSSIPLLIQGLGDAEPRIRFQCHEALRIATSRDFGYHVDAAETERQNAIQRWQQWYDNWERENG